MGGPGGRAGGARRSPVVQCRRSARRGKRCGSDSVPPRRDRSLLQLQGGRTYQVLVISESCAAAGTWISKLTRDSRGSRTADGGYAIAGGPTGWKCEGGGYPAVTHSAPTISGECYVGSLFSPTKYFYWKPSVT
jgi:hypothetical protein